MLLCNNLKISVATTKILFFLLMGLRCSPGLGWPSGCRPESGLLRGSLLWQWQKFRRTTQRHSHILSLCLYDFHWCPTDQYIPWPSHKVNGGAVHPTHHQSMPRTHNTGTGERQNETNTSVYPTAFHMLCLGLRYFFSLGLYFYKATGFFCAFKNVFSSLTLFKNSFM